MDEQVRSLVDREIFLKVPVMTVLQRNSLVMEILRKTGDLRLVPLDRDEVSSSLFRIVACQEPIGVQEGAPSQPIGHDWLDLVSIDVISRWMSHEGYSRGNIQTFQTSAKPRWGRAGVRLDLPNPCGLSISKAWSDLMDGRIKDDFPREQTDSGSSVLRYSCDT